MDDAQQRALELALAQAKRVNRESRILIQQLARLRDNDLQTKESQGNGNRNEDD
jgi:hypothetical protein